jgi:tetratricopeptide (TPR) repeat protein
MGDSTEPDIARLMEAAGKNPADGRAALELGNALYEAGRREEALTWWEKAARLDRESPEAWRNLGIGYYNVFHDQAAAKGAYQRAFKLSLAQGEEANRETDAPGTGGANREIGVPGAARILYERDQLWKLTGEMPDARLKELEAYRHLVRQRDDLTVEYCTLLNQTEQYDKTLEILRARKFVPWKGGEGLVLGQWARAHVGLGRRALWRSPGAGGDPAAALRFFEEVLQPPENLGEKWSHSDDRGEAYYWAGMAARATGQMERAETHFRAAIASAACYDLPGWTRFEGWYWTMLAFHEMGRHEESRRGFEGILLGSERLRRTPAKPGGVARSLAGPAVFDEDVRARQVEQALLLEALARHGLNGENGADLKTARRLLQDILQGNPSQALAADLLVALEWSS